MGCPTIYYRKILQSFACNLAYETKATKLAVKLCEENDIERLEKYILEQKKNLSTELFYYRGGLASMHTLKETDKNDGNDGFDACIGGLNMFERFIGLEKKEEKTE